MSFTSFLSSLLPHSASAPAADSADDFTRLFRSAKAEEAAAAAVLTQQSSASDAAFRDKLLRGKASKSKALIDNAFRTVESLAQKTQQLAVSQDELLRQKLAKGKRRRSVAASASLPAHASVVTALLAIDPIPLGMTGDILYDALSLSAQHGLNIGSDEGRTVLLTLLSQLCEEQSAASARRPDEARELFSDERELLERLQRNTNPTQRAVLAIAFNHPLLAGAILEEESALHPAGAAGSPSQTEAAAQQFALLRKLFLGAIKKLPSVTLIGHLTPALPLITEGYLDLNAPMKANGETALHIASRWGKHGVVDWLLKHGRVDVDRPTTRAETALHLAAAALDPRAWEGIAAGEDGGVEGCKRVVRRLIDAGASMSAKDAAGDTPMSIAARHGVELTTSADAMTALMEEVQRVEGRKAGEESKQEELLRLKLQKGKSSKQERLMRLALEDADRQTAKLSAEEARQQDVLAAKLSRGRRAKAQPTGETVDEGLFLQELLLRALSDVTKEQILAVVQADPSMEGVDLLVLRRCKGLTVDEARLVVGGEVQFGEGEIVRLRDEVQLIVDDGERLAIQRVLLLMQVNHAMYVDVLSTLDVGPDQSASALVYLNGGAPLPFPDVSDAATSAFPTSFTPLLPPALLTSLAALMVRYIGGVLEKGEGGVDVPTAEAVAKGELDWDVLAAAGVDTELLLSLLMLSPSDLSLMTVAKVKAMDDELAKLEGVGGDEADRLRAAFGDARRTYEEVGKRARYWREHERVDEAWETEGGDEAKVDEDTGLSNERQMKADMLQQLQALAAQHLGKSADELQAMSPAQMKDELTGKGVDTAIWDEMQRLTEAEVGRYLAQQKAERDSEAAMVRRMLGGKKLTPAKRRQLEDRARALNDAARLYDDMLSSLVAGEEKTGVRLSAEEEAAHQRMLAKMEAKRRQKLKEQEDRDTGLSTVEKVSGAMLEQLQAMAAEHLGRTLEELQAMSEADMKDELVRKGVDVDIWAEMQKLSEAEVGRYLAQQKSARDAEAAMLRRMLKGKGLTEAKRRQLEEREKALSDAGRMYDDLLSSLVAGEEKTGEQRTKEEEAAHQRMLDKLADRKRKKEQAQRDADTGLSQADGVQAYVVEQLKELAAQHLGRTLDEVQAMSAEQMKAELSRKGVNVDIWAEMQKLSEAEAAKFFAAQKAASDAEAAMLRRMLKGKGLTAAKRAELLAREKALLDASRLYDDMLSSLVAGELKQTEHLSAEESAAHQRLLKKLEDKRRRKEEAEKDADTGLSKLRPLSDATRIVLQRMVAEHLGCTLDELQAMGEEPVKGELVRKGVDLDVWDGLSRRSEADVGRSFARQKAQNDAEAAAIRVALRAKGLTDATRQQLLDREKLLSDAARLYDDLLCSLLSGEARRGAHRSQEEEAAHQLMLANMQARRRRRADDAPPDLLTIADNPALLTELLTATASHLSLTPDVLARMTPEEAQAETAKVGVDIDLTSTLRHRTEAEAADALFARRTRDDAEGRVIRKLFAAQRGRPLSNDERRVLEARADQLDGTVDLYDDVLRGLLHEQSKRLAEMTQDERDAHARMQAKLASRKRRAKAAVVSDELNANELLGDQPLLLHLIAPIASSHLFLTQAQLADLTISDVQQRLEAAGVPFDAADLLRAMMDSEAARWVHAQKEAADAELAMIRKLLAGKSRKLTDQEREALAKREAELSALSHDYDDLLRRMMEEERKRRGIMSEDERRAYDRMLEKLRRGKRSAGPDVDPSSLVGDHPVLMDALVGLAASHLSMGAEELRGMSVAAVQAALKGAGMDIDVMEMMRGLTDSEAAAWVHAQRMKAEAEADLLRKLLANKDRKLTAKERADAEARLKAVETEIDGYDGLLRRLLGEELRRQQHMSEEERVAQERMMEKLRKGRTKKPSAVNADTVVGDNALLMDVLSGLAAGHLSLSPDALAAMTVAEVQAELAKAGVDVDIVGMMRDLTDSEAATWIQAQRAKAEAEADLLRKLLSGRGRKLTDRERADAAARLKEVEAEIANYDDLLHRLLDEELRRQRAMDEEERLAYERMMDKLRNGKKKKPQRVEADPSSLVGDHPLLMDVLAGIAAGRVALTAEQMSAMTIEQVQAAFAQAGVDVDILGLMRDLTDSEAARWLQAQRARAEAEADLLRKLLKKKLSPKDRADAEEQLRAVEAEIANYDDLLHRLLEEELRRQRAMDEEERLAHERMMDKLRRGKSKKQQQDTIGPVSLTTVIGDNALLMDMLAGLAAAHLSLLPDQLSAMTVDELQTALSRAGVDIDILEMLRNLTDSEAAKWLQAQRAKAEAEADLLRRLLRGGKKLTAKERADAEARLKEVEAEIANYDDLLRRLLDEELKRLRHMEDEERLAYERKMDKLRKGKAKKAAPPSTTPDLLQLRERVRLATDRVFDALVLPHSYTCRRCTAVNAAKAPFCSFCLTPAPPAPSPTLSQHALLRYHRGTHHCCAGADVVNVVGQSLGVCTRTNFFEWVEAMTLVCTRGSGVWWDARRVVRDGRMRDVDAARVWLMHQNGDSVDSKRWSALFSGPAEVARWVGHSALHHDCMAMPDVLDIVV